MKLITHSTNLRYLIGFTGSSGFLLMEPRGNTFFTDFRYREIAQKLAKSKTRVPFSFVEMDANFEKNFAKAVGRSKTMEFESAHMSVQQLERWKKRLDCMAWKPLKETPEQQRLIKDKGEIRLMKRSQSINGKTFERIRKLIKPGMTELEIAWQIKVIGHELGAEDISFEPIVAFGPHSAIPHHQNTTRKLRARDIVLIDMGMKHKGYCSDMTRTFFMGKATAEQAAVYDLVLQAQEAAIAAVKPDASCASLDKIAREVMGDQAEHFGHSLGHGIGLDVHEGPGVSSRSKDRLREGMVVTMEPGIYLPGKFGVRIEDMGRVGKRGYENFTKVGKGINS